MGGWTESWTGTTDIYNTDIFVPLTITAGAFTGIEVVTSATVSLTVEQLTGNANGMYANFPFGPRLYFAGTGTFTGVIDMSGFVSGPLQSIAIRAPSTNDDRTSHYVITAASITIVTTAVADPPPPPPPPPPGPPRPPKPPGKPPGPPDPPGPPQPVEVKFHHNAQERVQYDTDYTILVTVRNAAGIRDLYANGTVTVKVSTDAITTPTTAIDKFTVNGVVSTAHLLTFVAGTATFTLRFPFSVTAIPVAAKIYLHALLGTFTPGTLSFLTVTQMQGTTMIMASPGLSFTVQPPVFIDVGAKFVTPVQVSAVSSTGAVNTAWTGDITLTMIDLTGLESTTFLGGAKTITPVSGVAVYPTLFITKVGFYTLHATSTVGTLVLTGVSTGIQVVGDDGEQELRQNLRDDGTLWSKTTNVTSPSYGSYTFAEQTTLDGDEAVTATVVNDGTSWCFPYMLKATLVRFKMAISTLASAPVIQLYSSQNTTTGQDGTWVLVTSMTPATTGVFSAEFAFSAPLYVKGLWLTLQDNGGAATAAWYSQQVMGKYLGSPVSYLSVVETLAGEHYVTIPAPLVVLGGVQSKFRSMQVRNNTTAAMRLLATHVPARSTGDTLMDDDNLFILDRDGNQQTNEFTLPAFATKLLQFQYTITAADNDKSGNHYGRITFARVDGETGWFMTAFVSGGGLYSDRAYSLLTGAQTSGISAQGQPMQYASLSSKRRVWSVQRPTDTATTVFCAWHDFAAGIVGPGGFLQITSWSGGAEDHVSGLGLLDNKLLIASDNVTTIVVPTTLANQDTTFPSVTRASCSTFTIPAQTTGNKYFCTGPVGSIFILNGTAAGSLIYRISSTGYVFATVNPATPMAGRVIRGCFWDDVNLELNVVSAVSGGNRIIARYTQAGVFINSVASTTEGTLEADGFLALSPYVYMFYGADKMYRHDLQTMAGATLKFDLATALVTGVNMAVVT